MKTNGTSVLRSLLVAAFIVFVFFFLLYIFSSVLIVDKLPPAGFTIVKVYNSKNSLSKLYKIKDINVFILGDPAPGESSPLEVVMISDSGTVPAVFKLRGRFTGFMSMGESFYISSNKGLWRFDEDGESGGLSVRFNVKKIADGFYGGIYERDGEVFCWTETKEIKLSAEKYPGKSKTADDINNELFLNEDYKLLKTGENWFFQKVGDSKPSSLEFAFPVEKIYRVGKSLYLFSESHATPEEIKGVNRAGLLLRKKLNWTGDILILRNWGIWSVDDSGRLKIVFKGPVKDCLLEGKTPYFLSFGGLWRINGTKTEKVTEIQGSVYTKKMFRSQLWVGASTGLWRISDDGEITHLTGNSSSRLSAGDGMESPLIDQILFRSGSVWAGGGKEVWRLSESFDWKPIKVAEGKLVDVVELENYLWVCASTELLRIDGNGKSERIEGLSANMTSVRGMQGALWLDSSTGLWRVDASGRAEKIINIFPKDLVSLRDGTIIAGGYDGGLYRIYPEGALVSSYSKNTVFRNLEKRFPKIWISGPHVLVVEFKPSHGVYAELFNDRESWNLSDGVVGFRVLIPGNKRTAASGSAVTPLQVEGWGNKNIEYDMRDENGNHFRGSISGFVIPSILVLLSFFLIVWIFFWIFIYHFSSRLQFSMNVLMNPFWRKIGFLGLFNRLLQEDILPLDAVMRRYLKNLRIKIDEEMEKSHCDMKDFTGIGKILEQPRSQGIIFIDLTDGKQGGMAFCTAKFILEEIRQKKSLLGMIPVIITGSRLKTDSIKENIYLELKTLGGITDESFCSMLPGLGVFAVIIQGIKGLDAGRAEVIKREMTEISQNNPVVVLEKDENFDGS